MHTRLHVISTRETAGKANFHRASPVLPPPLACLSRRRPASPSLPLIAAVKWVNLARTAQSRHRSCGSKSNWNIGNAAPFRFHDFCVAIPQSPLPSPSSFYLV